MLQHLTATYSFSYINWLQLAAEYGECSLRILTSPLTGNDYVSSDYVSEYFNVENSEEFDVHFRTFLCIEIMYVFPIIFLKLHIPNHLAGIGDH